jgi:hypothetical protein
MELMAYLDFYRHYVARVAGNQATEARVADAQN